MSVPEPGEVAEYLDPVKEEQLDIDWTYLPPDEAIDLVTTSSSSSSTSGFDDVESECEQD